MSMVREGWTSSLVKDTEAFEVEQRHAWQQLSIGQRLLHIRELSVMAYSAKGIKADDGGRLSRLDSRAQQV